MTAAFYLLLCLPLLLSFAVRGARPRVLGLVSSALAVLLSAEPARSVLPWALGMTIATVGLFECFRRDPA